MYATFSTVVVVNKRQLVGARQCCHGVEGKNKAYVTMHEPQKDHE
jgi:hypothetical protein